MAKFSTTHSRLIKGFIHQNLFDQVVEWIATMYDPEDIFPDQDLINWAKENGFVKAEEEYKMTEEQKAAVINASTARASIRAMGMQAENVQRQHLGLSMAYLSADFENVITEEGIHPNHVHGVIFGD